ncbi:MAG: DUF58 domain-containing protein [Acidimicrobiales bacterium]|jgi:uncharacterized protein (DUF58 family)
MKGRSRRQVPAADRARSQATSTVRVRHLALPERAFGPVAGSVLLLLVWAGVAHASGSGWVQTVGAVVAGLLLLGLVAPAFAAPGLAVICERSPTDALAGSAVEIDVVGNRSMRCTPRSAGGKPVLLTGKIPASLVIVPPRRGVISTVTVRVATAAPLGLLWWSRDQVLELARPLYVAPQPRERGGELRQMVTAEEGQGPPRPTLTGDLRGIRPYQHGDGRRRVHWHASAHTGDLMIRESESRRDDPIRMVVDLPGDLDAADRVAEQAMGEIVLQLNAGRRIVLETTEITGTVITPVADRLSAGRRLARAVASYGAR